MVEETTCLMSPIDVMYLIHKALRAEAARVERMVGELELGGSIQPFKAAFDAWVSALGYHDEREDQWMTAVMEDCPEARENEAYHAELWEKLGAVMEVVNEEIGKTRLLERTKGHLFGQVLALRIAQEDHLESEEAFFLPVVRECMTGQQEAEVAERLLIDEEAEEPRWFLKWVAQKVAPKEREWLAQLEASFARTTTAAH